MTALVVITVVLAVALVGLALLYRSQGVVVARQRKHNELLRRHALDLNIFPVVTVPDLERVISRHLPSYTPVDYRQETSHEVAPGCLRITITEPERQTQPSCICCGDLGVEGGCRVCGQ